MISGLVPKIVAIFILSLKNNICLKYFKNFLEITQSSFAILQDCFQRIDDISDLPISCIALFLISSKLHALYAVM